MTMLDRIAGVCAFAHLVSHEYLMGLIEEIASEYR